uniref:Uncharacterized protein n=1 Tax=Oryza nivara TaxID=4536 RepID=A0A0E0HR06_ORYNI
MARSVDTINTTTEDACALASMLAAKFTILKYTGDIMFVAFQFKPKKDQAARLMGAREEATFFIGKAAFHWLLFSSEGSHLLYN